MSVFRSLPMLLVMGIIFFLSQQSGTTLAIPQIYGLDKCLHMLAYGTLAATVIYAVPAHAFHNRNPWKTRMLILLFCVFYGMTDEFHQSFIPGRDVSFFDLLADAAGAGIVLLLEQMPWVRERIMLHR
ncbi:MAG: teicoplanin resistance protein VanZ [Desulfobulbus sp.]|nr:MAG: teicoplanin resistance protein VanZ [Desulfobulbus sp.]